MTASNPWRAFVLALALLGGAYPAAAQFTLSPLHLGAQGPVSNEFGVLLSGNANQPGCAVRVLWATNGIYPPDLDGSPNPSNAPVVGGQCGLGFLTSPYVATSGLFGLLLHPRPTNGLLFVRVFNHADPTQASFYADSPAMNVSGASVLAVKLGATTNALDSGDDDSDGLNNSWEKSYGSNPAVPDSDDDGLNDGDEHLLGLSPIRADTDDDGVTDSHEWRAGTDGRNPGSYLGVSELLPTQADLLIQWASVTGKLYQVEAADGLAQPAAFSNVTEIIPADAAGITSTTLTNALEHEALRLYRIRLVEE
jgi:hypothetical protein